MRTSAIGSVLMLFGLWIPLFFLSALMLILAPVHAEPVAPVAADEQLYQDTLQRAIRYLQTKGQAEDGSFSAEAGPGVTALVATALLRNGRNIDEPIVAKSLKYLQGFVQKDGGIYAKGTYYRNYETCIAMMCFAEAARQRPGTYDQLIQRAENFVKGLQYDEDEGHDQSSPAHGGTGYGKHKRPDLSNAGMFVDALRAVGSGPDDPAMQKALLFISRCQNHESPHNDTKWSTKVQDGGFYYTPAAGGSSQAKWPEGESEDVRGLRSYGSMTYVGLKSMIYAGVDQKDSRVKAATEWIRKNYSLKENPGLGPQGLFYYYHTFAKALEALGEDQFADANGVEHDWRSELVETLARQQKPDGSWINSHSRWLEADPNLVTGYALLALSHCRSK